MPSNRALLLTAVVLIAGMSAGATVGRADDFVAVSTTVTPSEPVPEEPFTIEATVTNDDDSDNLQIINQLEVRNGTGSDSELLAERTVDRRLDAGDRATFSVAATINETGTHTVYLHLRLLGGKRIVQPVTVDVHEPHPKVDVSVTAANPGEPRAMTVRLSNGLEESIRNVEVLVEGRRIDLSSTRRVTALIEAGGSAAFEFTATPETATELPVDVTVRYSADGDQRSVTRTLRADFAADDEPAEHPRLAVSVQDAVPGASRSLNVTVANGLDADVRQVTVTVSSPAARFETTERVQAVLAAGRTVAFAFPATVSETGEYPVEVALTYTEDGIRERITRTFNASFDAPSNPGEVRLTGLDATQTGDTVEISATASNVGSSDVQSVVVSLGDAEGLTQAEYFVGSIEASDFASFTLTTEAAGNRSSVPLEVTYVVDGVERTVETSVPVERAGPVRPAASAGGGGLPLVPAGAVLGVLVVGAVVYRWRG